MSDILLTISLLCCGREKDTIRCLDSLKPILEAVPSELILVDTGCTEKFREKLFSYTDKVISFEWCDDFSAARNVGVKAAKGKWFMAIDDDEWIDDCSEFIAFFNEGKYKNYTEAYYIQKNFLDKDCLLVNEAWVSRMFKLGKGVGYVGRIHEIPNALPGEVCYINARVNHTGYIYENDAERMAHTQRNIRGLVKMLEKDPEDVRCKLQLIQEYFCIKEYDKLIDVCFSALEFLKGNPGGDMSLIRVYLSVFYTGVVLAMNCQGRVKEALENYEKAMSDDRLIEVGRARLHNLGAILYNKNKEYEKSIECADNYIQIYNKYADDYEYVGRNTILYSKDAYMVEFMNETLMVKALCALSVDRLEESKEAVALLDRSKYTGDNYREMLYLLVDKIIDNPDNQDLINILKDFSNISQLFLLFYSKVCDLYREDKDRFNVLAHALENVYNDCFVYDFFRIAAAFYDGREEECEEAIHQISAKYFFPGIEDLCMGEYEFAVSTLDTLLSRYEMSVNKARFINMKLAEMQVLHRKPEEYNSFEQIVMEIGEYTSRVVDFYSLYYTEYAFDGDLEMLPDRARYAGFMSGFLTEATNGNYRDAFGVLKEMVKTYTVMEKYTLRLTKLYGEFVAKTV